MRALLASSILFVGCATEGSQPAGVARDAGVDVATDTASIDEPAAGSIRIAALNVRRLFDDRCDSGSCARDDFEAVLTTAEIESRTTTIASRLSSIRASVICLEEVETRALLDKVASKMPGFSTHILGEIGQTASLDVGLISTFPAVRTQRHRDRVLLRPDGTSTTFTRELLEVHLDVRGQRAIVLCAHFRSKSSDDPGRRLAEARAARDIVVSLETDNPGALVVLGGDLNDTPGSPPLLALDEGLVRVSAGMPDDQIATYWFEGRGTAIDHFFIAKSNAPRKLGFMVVRDDGRAFAGSDHAAIRADFSGF